MYDPTKIDAVTASRIARSLDDFNIDVADAISSQAAESTRLALANGWDPASDTYDIQAMPGDLQALEALLERRALEPEARALEVCVRHHMAAAVHA